MRDPKSRGILHLALGPTLRGGERQALRLHNGLRERSVPSWIACRQKSALACTAIAGIEPFAWNGPADAIGLARLLGLCRRLRPALLHCHDAHAFTLGSLAGWLLGIPLIMTRRVLFPIRPSTFNRWKFGRCRHVVAVSNAVAEACRRIAGATPVSVIADGVTWNEAAPSRHEIREELALDDKAYVIGSVSYFTPEKNLPLLIETADYLKARFGRAVLLLIGPMDEKSRLAVSQRTNIRAIGAVPAATRYYTAFDAYLSTATSEGLGSALLDAVVRDIPAIALDGGGTADIFPPGSPALIDPRNPSGLIDGLAWCISDRAAARARAAAEGARARTIFSVERMVEAYGAIYAPLLHVQP
jgi:glycosyltransferase involved in cell wall biosynthesis